MTWRQWDPDVPSYAVGAQGLHVGKHRSVYNGALTFFIAFVPLKRAERVGRTSNQEVDRKAGRSRFEQVDGETPKVGAREREEFPASRIPFTD